LEGGGPNVKLIFYSCVVVVDLLFKSDLFAWPRPSPGKSTLPINFRGFRCPFNLDFSVVKLFVFVCNSVLNVFIKNNNNNNTAIFTFYLFILLIGDQS
jgi:hypothetical protein